MFVLEDILQRLDVIRERIDLIARLRPIDQIEQIDVVIELELGLVIDEVIQQLLGLLVEQLVESMRLHEMRIGDLPNGAQVLLDVEDVAAHLRNAVRAYLFEVLDCAHEYARQHEA